MITKMNPYYLFLLKLVKSEGLTVNGFGEKYDIPSLSSIMNQLKNSPDKKVHPETLKKISDGLNREKGTNFMIDDSDINNIHLTVTTTSLLPGRGSYDNEFKFQSFPLFRGSHMVKLIDAFLNNNSSTVIKFDSLTNERVNIPFHHSEAIAGTVTSSMNADYFQEGDILLFDLKSPVNENAWCFVVLNTGKYFIGQYKEIDRDKFILNFFNPRYTPMVLNKKEIKFIYRVATSWRVL